MAVLKNFDGNELCVNCTCGCDEGIHIKIDKYNTFHYALLAFTNGKFYAEQDFGFIKKLKKIWAIIRNKDFYYSEIILNKKDWEEYKKWINEK